jgi:hypothetical protein
MAAMQHGSSLRFTLITLAMAGLAATAGWLIWGLVRRAGPDLAGSWRAKIAAVHGALVALGLLTTVAVLLTWRFGVLI